MPAVAHLSTHRFQALPTTGALHDNLNLDRDELLRRLGARQESAYSYIVTTVSYTDGQFRQTGSAPNFQGGLVTLCTCKGQLRAGKSVNAWPGVWVAGVTSRVMERPGAVQLFFLMRVSWAFCSHRDLWQWLVKTTPETAEAKAADRHRHGDVYRPMVPCDAPFSPSAYYPPCRCHVHHARDRWRQDIDDFQRAYRRRPALLVGDPALSFLWSEPRVHAAYPGRGCRHVTLDELLGTS